jgi:hypothetical protein
MMYISTIAFAFDNVCPYSIYNYRSVTGADPQPLSNHTYRLEQDNLKHIGRVRWETCSIIMLGSPTPANV